MADPTLPPSLAAEIADLKRRLNNLERSQRLPFSSTRGGAFLFLDDGGGPRLVLGNASVDDDGLITPQAVYGVVGHGDDATIGLLLKQGVRGLAYPIIPIPMTKAGDLVAVTSGTFVTLFETTVDFPAEEVIVAVHAVVTDAGTTGEVRLRDTSSGTTTSAQSIPAAYSGVATFKWLHPSLAGLNDQRFVTESRVAPLAVEVQARRTGGAGNVNVYASSRVFQASVLLYPDAATNGNPSRTP